VVEVARAVAGAPAGARIVIAETTASARDAVAAPAPSPPAATPTTPPDPGPEKDGGGDGDADGDAADEDPEATPTPSAAERAERRRRARERAEQRRAEREIARLAAGDFTFPVAGPTTFTDDWGGPRQIGPHQGNDLFAPFGTPVVAVADGRIERVGTLPISGNRFWLRTPGGDAFFYAHLASFAPAAQPGRRVTAGTVLGYLGNTGDAEPTPPHLHFEAHPAGGGAVNPFVALTAWQEQSGVAGDADAAAEQPGALVEVRDLIAG
jgi:murein DD-endopeptidase MepM/ murein hydrolase activator NlpD